MTKINKQKFVFGVIAIFLVGGLFLLNLSMAKATESFFKLEFDKFIGNRNNKFDIIFFLFIAFIGAVISYVYHIESIVKTMNGIKKMSWLLANELSDLIISILTLDLVGAVFANYFLTINLYKVRIVLLGFDVNNFFILAYIPICIACYLFKHFSSKFNNLNEDK